MYKRQMPISRNTPLVETDSSQMAGLTTLLMTLITPADIRATRSACFIPRRLGTSSPNTMVK